MARTHESVESVEKRYDRAVNISPLTAFILKASAAIVLFAGLAYLIGGLLPWRPVEVYGFEAVPKRACVNAPVQITTDRTLKRGLPPNVRDLTIEIKSHWQNVETGKSTPEETLAVSEVEDGFGPYGRHDITSPLIREAPPDKGTWRLVGTYKMVGTPLYIRRTYTVEEVTSGPILKTYAGERCKGEG